MNEFRPELEQALERLKVNRFDEAGWVTLYDQLVPRARAASYRILGGDVATVADVVQDALERLLRYGEFSRLGVDKTWGSCGAFSVCDGQPTIENCGPCDGYSVSPFGRPPHPSALSHAGIGNVID